MLALCISNINAVPLNDELVILHNATTAEMNALASPEQGSLIFNTDDNLVYERNSTAWHSTASEGSETKVVAGRCMDITGVGTSSNPYIVNYVTPGKTPQTAKKTCKRILEIGCPVTSGIYWINPNGGTNADAFEVYCDMTTDGGGWTRLKYASDLIHKNHRNGGSGADVSQWWDGTFSLTLSNQQINDIRAVSTEGKQRYVGTCDGVIHYEYNGGYGYAFGFRFHNGEETAFGQQTYPSSNINVVSDGCETNSNSSTDTIFEINDIRVPVIGVHSRDNGASGELFGSPLTNNPAWLR